MADTCAEHSAHRRAIGVHDERLRAHGEQLDKLTETLAALREIERQNQQRLDEHADRLIALEAKPAKRWETVTNYIFTAVIALIVGVIAGQIGLN